MVSIFMAYYVYLYHLCDSHSSSVAFIIRILTFRVTKIIVRLDLVAHKTYPSIAASRSSKKFLATSARVVVVISGLCRAPLCGRVFVAYRWWSRWSERSTFFVYLLHTTNVHHNTRHARSSTPINESVVSCRVGVSSANKNVVTCETRDHFAVATRESAIIIIIYLPQHQSRANIYACTAVRSYIYRHKLIPAALGR